MKSNGTLKKESHHSALCVVVQSADHKKCETVGPYATFKKADADMRAWDGINGCNVWIEPMIKPEVFARVSELLEKKA